MTHQFSNAAVSDPNCTHPANDLIEAIAFGFATEEERQILGAHVGSCEICAAALMNARFAAEVLPISVPDADVQMPDRIWAGIEARIAETAPAMAPQAISSPSVPAMSSRPGPMRVHWAVAAVLALLTLAGGVLLGRAVFDTESQPEQNVAQVTVTDPDIAATGTVRYDADDGVLVLHMEDMPAAPEGFVYQVWVIDGETPVPVGIIDAESANFATASDPARFQTLAVTLEEGPLGNDLPTTDPIVVADLTSLGGD